MHGQHLTSEEREIPAQQRTAGRSQAAVTETGMTTLAAANEQWGFQRPLHAERGHLSFCQFT